MTHKIISVRDRMVFEQHTKTLKAWVLEEAAKRGLKPNSIYSRLARNQLKYYPEICLTRLNQRVILVNPVITYEI